MDDDDARYERVPGVRECRTGEHHWEPVKMFYDRCTVCGVWTAAGGQLQVTVTRDGDGTITAAPPL